MTYVIEGSIWMETERVRVTAQLIDARTGQNVWAEKFDRSGTDPLALQDEVTERIIGTLGGQRGMMYRNEFKKAWEKEPTKLGEYDFYLRSNSFFQQFTPESSAEAMKITEEGLAKCIHSQFDVLNVVVAVESTHHGVDTHAVECRFGRAHLIHGEHGHRDAECQ